MPETERYLNFVAGRFDLRKDIQFKTRVTAASYDEAIKRWSITTDEGETFQARYFIIAAVWEEQGKKILKHLASSCCAYRKRHPSDTKIGAAIYDGKVRNFYTETNQRTQIS